MNDDPASSKNGSASLSMSTMYMDMNREAASISPMHHRIYAVLGISLYFAIRYSHPLVIDLDTFEVLKSDDEKFTCDGRKAKILSITNKNVNKSSQVSSVEVMKEPFEKTATQKIRRFKYKESAPTVEEEQRNKR